MPKSATAKIFGRRATGAEARTADRAAVAIPATARTPAGERMPIEIQDLSASGFRARVTMPILPGKLLRVGLPTGRSPHARVVWADEGVIGCAFVGALEPDELAALVMD